MQLIETNEDLAVALADSYDQPILLLKTSNVCSLSLRIYNELKGLEERQPALSEHMFVLVVQDAPGVSEAIVSRFGIIHETPQAIVVVNEDPVYYESHEEISVEKIASLLKEKPSGNDSLDEGGSIDNDILV